MATQKQRRRRAKEKRHEYDLVYVDDEGIERPLEREESPRKPAVRGSRASGGGGAKGKSSSSGQRRVRQVQPPSWRKVFKRGAIFAPIFLATVMLIEGGKLGFAQAVFNTLLLLAVFVPFSYFMDRFMWRQQQKRLGRGS